MFFHICISNLSLIANYYLKQKGGSARVFVLPTLLHPFFHRLKYRLSQTSALSFQTPQTFQTLYSCKWRPILLGQMTKDVLHHTDISESRGWPLCLQLLTATVLFISADKKFHPVQLSSDLVFLQCY